MSVEEVVANAAINLSKREHYAGLMMAALLELRGQPTKDMAAASVYAADLLIDALNEVKK